MKLNKEISILLAVVILFSAISFSNTVYADGQSITYYKNLDITNQYHIPATVPNQSDKGHLFNDKYWIHKDYRVIVYGTPSDVEREKKIANEYKMSPTYGTMEYRYLGFDTQGNPFSNTRFPNDADSGIALADKKWVKNPWDSGLCEATIYSNVLECAADINKMATITSAGGLGWSPDIEPKDGIQDGVFFRTGNVQSYPTLLAEGSFRMWHLLNGKYWYQTFPIPKKTLKTDTPFIVTTEILSSDFTIAENESTVDVAVGVTAKLEDDIVYDDDIKRVLEYNRDDIKKWDLKVEYKGTDIHYSLDPNNTNTVTKIFNIKLSRNQVVDKEKVTFNGIGRVTFHNEKYLKDADPETSLFTVITPPPAAELPPDLTISAPAKVNVKELYSVKVNPVVPQGESIKTIVLEGSINGGAYQPIALSSNSASQQYNNIGTINYRATVTLNNNKAATATATTNVVDERKSDATAKIEQPGTAYEGYWLTVKNKNTFTFEGTTYNAQHASDSGIGSSDFDIQDNSEYSLESNLYQTRNYNSNIGFDIRYMQPGLYKNTIYALPRNGEGVTDTRGIQIMRCPAIIASVDGTKKSNRKMTLNFSSTVNNPDYPLVSSKTYAIIEDTVTGEKVTVTNSSHPDSTNIKTNILSGNRMDFLIKTSVDRTYKATVYVEDTRGNNDTQSITFTVLQDKAPISKISTKDQELRDPSLSNKAEIFLQDDSYSEDGDFVTRTWEVAYDTNNNGAFWDEAYYAVNLFEGYQDLSGDGSQKKVRFLKTGVGKFDARVKSKEVFGQPTIEAFVTVADRKENTVTKVVDVINVAPVVDFKIFSNISTTINLVVGSLSDSLQSSVQSLIASMQSTLISNKITPTINYIPQTTNPKQPIWNQNTGNAQNTNQSQFSGILNTNIKWQTGSLGINGNTVNNSPQLLILPNGNILVRKDNQFWVFDKSGNLVNSITITIPAYSAPVRDCVILSDGRIIVPYVLGSGPCSVSLYIYNSSLVKVNEVLVTASVASFSNIHVDNNDNIYMFMQGVYNTHSYYYNVFNPDLSLKVSRAYTGDYYPYEFVVDNAGNTYYQERYTQYGDGRLVKLDPYGNRLWELDDCADVQVFDEQENCVYIRPDNNWSTGKKTLKKVNASTGALILSRQFTSFDVLSHTSLWGDYLYCSDNGHSIKEIRKSDLALTGGTATAGDSPNKPIISSDGQMFSFSTLDDYSQIKGGAAGLNQQLHSIDGSEVGTFAAAYSTDNTLYMICCRVSGYGSYGQAIYNNPLYIRALGTGGTEQNIDNTLRKLRDYVPVNGTRDFTVSITDSAFKDNSEANIANTANLLKAYNDNFFMIGGGNSLPDGQRIWNYGTGGNLYWLDSNMWNPLSAITNFIVSTIAPTPTQRAYEYYYDKGEIVNYDAFYSDYELDPSQYGWWRYVHTPYTDGYFPQNGQWLGAPVTQFWQNGTYIVQHLQADWTGVPAYDRQSNVAEMTIHVGDGVVIAPPTGHTPKGSIELDGSLKQNRKLSLKLAYSNNNNYPLGGVYWGFTPLSGMSANDIKYTALTGQTIDSLYKLSGWVRATCSFHDSLGYWNTITKDYYINPDLAPTGTLQVTPVTYRNSSGVASINVKSNITSPDDYIDSLKYYITYDSDNNGSYANDMQIYLPQYDNLRDFNLDINTKLGVMATTQSKSGVSIVNAVNPGTLQPVQAIRLDAGASVPVITSESLNLAQNTNYTLEFDYWSDTDNALFDVDLWPDDLPQIYPTAMKTLQHYQWTFSSGSANTLNSYLRFFNDRTIPNPSNIYLTNINLYNTSSLNLIRSKSGVGNYLIQTDVKEGFQEPTIPAFIAGTDYLGISLQGVSKVDNISPTYDAKPEKNIYLVGEEIRFKSYDGSFLNGDNSKGFFDSENDPMTSFEVRYAQNKAIMPIQDATSTYATPTVDYMSNVLNWKDPNIWEMSSSIVWDAAYQAWKVTGYGVMYLKPEYAAKINPDNSYYMEIKTLRQNDYGQLFYWGGDRLNSSKQHLDGYWGTYDYTAASALLPAVGSWVTYGATKAGPAASQYGWGSDCAYYRIGGLINYYNNPNQVTYVKDIKFIMPNVRWELDSSLDRAGEYTINVNAFDDPKAGDIRFNSFKKASNTSSNKIIVHRRPVAALSFTSSHATASSFNFGNNMYLDGTQLRIFDASSDPDGFSVTSSISYKVNSGDYIQLNSGNTINLYYGSIFTIKVVTTDNWGADDTAIYIISVVNDLDMEPEIIPSTIAASETITARLTTNQYATSARVVIFGTSYNLTLVSSTATEKVWETQYTVVPTRADASYTAQFYAVSEGTVELRADRIFQVLTPINLVPSMPDPIITGTSVTINATTTKYASTTTVQLYRGTPYQTSVLNMTGSVNGSSKSWTNNYAVPANIPTGNYTARFISSTLNGNTEIRDVTFNVISLKAYNFKIIMIQDTNWREYYFDIYNGIDDNDDGVIDRYPRKASTDIYTTQMPINQYGLVPYGVASVKAGPNIKGSVMVIGEPDSVSFTVKYMQGGATKSATLTPVNAGGGLFTFEWIVPMQTDQNTYISFDLHAQKGSNTYGNEIWKDTWAPGNTSNLVLYINGGTVQDDIIFHQSN